MGGSIADAIGAIANPVGYITGQLPTTLAVSSKRRDEFTAGVKGAIQDLAGVGDMPSLPEAEPAPTNQDAAVQAAAREQRLRRRGKASTYLFGTAGPSGPSSVFKSSLI